MDYIGIIYLMFACIIVLLLFVFGVYYSEREREEEQRGVGRAEPQAKRKSIQNKNAKNK